MANILQTVQTYQSSMLGYLQNFFAFINTSNTRFKEFNKLVANLGSTVTFDLPPRMLSQRGLVVNTFSGVTQRVASLTVGGNDAQGLQQQANVNFAFTAQDLIFNIDNNDYRAKFEKSAVMELGTQIEASVAGQIEKSTYRFYGDGVNPINSYGQLANALAFFRNYGSVNSEVKGYLSDIAIPSIINNSLTQFVLDRNQETFNSWELGMFDRCNWYKSNLLPIHTAGTLGNAATVLTLVSVDPTGTMLTFSGAGTDANAVFAGDLFQFQDNVGGQPNIRYLTFIGHEPSANPVQFMATAPSPSSGGSVTITVNPPLISDPTNVAYNLSVPLAAGMQVIGLPTHRCGLISGGDPLFLGMPMLPDQAPFYTANEADQDSGVSIRLTTGSQFAQNSTGTVLDCIWGATLVPEYSMRVVFPLSQ